MEIDRRLPIEPVVTLPALTTDPRVVPPTEEQIVFGHHAPIILGSGRMACVPAWEQDLMEQRKHRTQEREE